MTCFFARTLDTRSKFRIFMYLFLRQNVKEDAKNTRSVKTYDVKNTYVIASTINHRHDHKYAPPYSKKNI